ncbi:MAG: hypothetical protein BWY95_02307 [Bacteroidetes bacterium ADurb.BinA104]|nr:MAG: hypothetical protein BWY95_02307 [Bacteroidetes bacterium ADurb.BinA104]
MKRNGMTTQQIAERYHYSKELHDWVKSNNVLCEHAGLPTVTYTREVIATLLDEIERLQAENKKLSDWVDNVCKTAICWSIYSSPSEGE